MCELPREELEEALELVHVAPQGRREQGGIVLGRLECAHLHLQASVEPLDAAEHVHGVPLGKPPVEQLDVVPHAAFDAAARVDQLEREVGLPLARRQPPLPRDREDPVDRAVLGELGDHRGECRLGGWPTSVRSARSGTPARARR